MDLIIFDDGRHDLSPMTDLRAVFEIRTGVLTTRERIEATRRNAGLAPAAATGLWVPERIAALVGERSSIPVNQSPRSGTVLLVSGRWLLPDLKSEPGVLLSHPRSGEAIVATESGDVIVACLNAADAEVFLRTGALPPTARSRQVSAPLLSHPHEVITHRDAAIAMDFHLARLPETALPAESVTTIEGHGVEIHRTAKVYPGAILDAEHGPIAIDEHAVVRPGAILCGPCHVGRSSVVIDRAHIKPHTVIGPVCKVGGEVGGTIFQGYSNKAHDGHLGDSWVGEWVNFGAGTTNSNLLNTYGEVVMKNRPDGQRRRTGLTFLGAIVGDHVKFAINTRIMTGSVFGTGAMIATTAPPPTTVPAFAWMTDEGTRQYRMEKFLEVAKAVMGRRGVGISAHYQACLNCAG